MASNTIAKASLLLTANSAQLNKGLAESEDKIRKWGDKQGKNAADIGKDAGEQSGSSFKGVKTALTAMGVAAVAAGAIMRSAFTSVAEAAEKTIKASREIGVSVQSLSALQHVGKVLGVSVEDVNGALENMKAALHQADEPAERLFRQLGLSVSDLRKMGEDDAFLKINRALQSIEDQTLRDALTVQIYKDKSLAIFPVLEKGYNDIKDAIDNAKQSGVALNEAEAGRLKRAHETLNKFGENWTYLTNQIALATAAAIEWAGSVLPALDSVAAKLDGLLGTNMFSEEQTFKPLAKKAGEDIGDAMGEGLINAFKANQALTKIRQAISGAMGDLEKDLQKGMATVGMDAGLAKLFDIKQMPGINDVSKARLNQLEQLAIAARNVQDAWGVIEVPPLEMWGRQIDGLNTMLESGRISMEQYQRGVAKAGLALSQATGGGLKTVGAALADSSAAVSAVIKSELQDRVSADPAAELRRAQAEQKEIMKAQLETAKAMLKEIEKGNEEDDWELF